MINLEQKLLSQRSQLLEQIRQITAADFDALALEVFRFQAAHNAVYREFVRLLGINPDEVRTPEQIPYLPISAFKHHELQTLSWTPATVFTSSGTTGMQTSRHLLRDEDWYAANARRGFTHFYGDPGNYCFLALLPSYLERSGSSLVYMAQDFIRRSSYPESGFFLHDTYALHRVLAHCRDHRIPTVLLGVSFALWDFAESHPIHFPELIVMETGGMKGRREEITREALHEILKEGFGVQAIHSEYGMTELLSQAYAQADGVFHAAPTMRIRIRDMYDPLALQETGRTGLIDIADLANIDTLSFIATDDLGKILPEGGFQVLGRLDYSDLRGCNLMV